MASLTRTIGPLGPGSERADRPWKRGCHGKDGGTGKVRAHRHRGGGARGAGGRRRGPGHDGGRLGPAGGSNALVVEEPASRPQDTLEAEPAAPADAAAGEAPSEEAAPPAPTPSTTGALKVVGAQLTDASRRRDEQRRELEQIQARSPRPRRIPPPPGRALEALEGSAAALRAEAEGKAQGQSELQARTAGIREAIAELNMRRAGLEAEQQAAGQSLTELEALRRDLTGDRAERERMLTAFEEKNAALEEEILEKERRLQAIRQENRERQEAIARINEEKLALEARRNQADKQAREKNSELLNLEREVSVLEQRKAAAALEEKTLLDKLWETYELSHEAARAQRVELESVPKAQRRVGELKKAISGLGNINLDAIEEFQRVNERYTYLTDQRDDVLKSKKELEGIIADITEEMKTIFARQFSVINEAFQQTFTELFGGGKATLELEEPEDILNCGIEIRVQPPGKALKVLSLLSGGEKAFVAIALYFAILKVRPTPFCVMDEIEAALDDANVVRFARYMRQMADKTQFIVITHRRGTMEEADVLYGVTMQEQGVSRMLTINLNDVEKELKLR